ncbi:MAG: helix-turn-helix domain-containing protein [Firmicutes bacterium]|jgi:excisionase family DNA binding protein|nr:helix-turn-helix domain-containing protein [Bacillota bacterium]
MPNTSVHLIAPNDKEFASIKKIASRLEIAPVENEFVILDEAHNVRMELPPTLYRVLLDAAQQLAQGNTVGVLHYEQAVTTQQAAEILQVSRPYVVKLLEDGDIPFYQVGSHRRMSVKDVLDYKTRRDAHRKSQLVELYQASHDAGLYDVDDFPQDGENLE